jgi:hypothetical protein
LLLVTITLNHGLGIAEECFAVHLIDPSALRWPKLFLLTVWELLTGHAAFSLLA